MESFIYVLKLVKDYGVEGIEEESIVASLMEENLESIKDSIEAELKNKDNDLYFTDLYLTSAQKLSLRGNWIKAYMEIEQIYLV